MTKLSQRARVLIFGLLAALVLALTPAMAAAAAGPGSMTLTITSATPLSPFTFVMVQGPEGAVFPSFDGQTATATDLALGDYTATIFASSDNPGGSVSFSLTTAAPDFVGELVVPSWPTGTASLTGSIVDDSGTPIAGANVNVRLDARQFPGLTTDSDGAFTLGDLPAGTYDVSAFAPANFVRSTQVVIADGESAQVTLVLPLRDASIAGRVVDGSGNPIPDVFVNASRPSSGGGIDGSGASSASDGTFQLSELGAGDWLVSAGGPGSPWLQTQVTVTLGHAENLSIDDLVLSPRTTALVFGYIAEGTTSVAGICASLLTGTGAPVPGQTSTTAEDGTFLFSDVAPGEYTVKFVDCDATRQPPYLTAFYGGSTTLTGATRFTVVAAQDVSLDPITLVRQQGNPMPPVPAVAVKLTDLRLSTLGHIQAPSALVQGQSFTITVGTAEAGTWVSVWLRTPTAQLGQWLQVAGDGTVSATVPAHYAAGLHAVVVQNSANRVVGWTNALVRTQASCHIHRLPRC
jgi:hypothetical protein